MTVIQFPGPGRRDDPLLARAVALKQELVRFVLEGPVRADLTEFAPGVDFSEPLAVHAIEVVDFFIFEWTDASGAFVLDLFVEERSDLSDADRDLLVSWFDAVEDTFLVRTMGETSLELADLSGVTYTVERTTDDAGKVQWEENLWVNTRLLPVGNVFIFSGIQQVSDDVDDLVDDAETQFDEMASTFFANISRVFEEYFGDSEIDLKEKDVDRTIVKFRDYQISQNASEADFQMFTAFLEGLMNVRPALHPGDYDESLVKELDTVTLMMSPDEGSAALPGYAALRRFVEKGVGDPTILSPLVLDFLESGGPPFAFRRLADFDKTRFANLMSIALDDPDFDVDEDLEDVLHEYLEAHMDRLEAELNLDDEAEE